MLKVSYFSFLFFFPCREISKSEQQAMPQSNHITASSNSTAHADVLHHSGWVEVTEREPRHEQEVEARLEVPVKVVYAGDGDANGVSLESGAPSRTAPSAAAQRNGVHSEQNGGVAYQRGVTPRTDTEKHVQRKSTLAQVEHWVKVQKGDPKRSVHALFFTLILIESAPSAGS